MIVLRSARCGQYGLLTGSCNQFPKGQPRSSGSRRRKALRNRFCICRHFRKRREEGRTAAPRCCEPRERGGGRRAGELAHPRPQPLPGLGGGETTPRVTQALPASMGKQEGKGGGNQAARQGGTGGSGRGVLAPLLSCLRPTPGSRPGRAALGASRPRSDSQVLLSLGSGAGRGGVLGEKDPRRASESLRGV